MSLSDVTRGSTPTSEIKHSPAPASDSPRPVACELSSSGPSRAEFTVEFEPRFDYARTTPRLERSAEGVVAASDDERLFLFADDALADRLELSSSAVVRGTVSLAAGESCWIGVQYGGREPLSSIDPAVALDETKRYWREWVSDRDGAPGSIPERWHEMVVRSELVLKLLIHHETGAIPAAATTSLPEAIGSDRCWDYRYNWVRDAKFAVEALHDTGHREEARHYFDWFSEIARTDPEAIQPVYGLHGETDIDERILDHLSGYRDTGPVRVGNAAATQYQLDIYGTIVQAVSEMIQLDRETAITDDEWNAICAIVDVVRAHWDERDAGIWEFRNERRHFLHSKLLCWVALDRGIALATETDFEAPLERWREEREAVREAIEDRGYSSQADSFVQHFETDVALDATALLIPVYGFLPPEDARVQATIDAVIDRLTTDDGLVVRFVDTDVRRDERTAFLLCSFWLIDALVLSNRLDRAREYFENVLEYASPLGLYSEKVDPRDGQLLGNFPQAFSHLGLLNSVTYLARAIETDGDVMPTDVHPDHDESLFRCSESPDETECGDG
ncbi:glycoside hydrolase family 15 protein [Halosolutus halophilus]|uniref:glycoside hydrolase family 15 protein n=1 Tax=Halosolutus halophilus TaxID=1552990 RepID=UPI00223520BF|nr:glycoside hydrolase family 15 protein [Halosolutus halophilus]